VKKLPAGHFFIYDLNKKYITVKKYWELDVTQIEERSPGEWKEIVSEKLKEAVKRWTLSDVPIACSLSGGLDSSAVVGILAGSGLGNIKTYSLGFEGEEEQGCNELPLARKVSEKWGAEHHEVTLKPEKIIDDLDRMVWHLDEPYAGGLPSWYIYELIGKDVKVALTGTGGDELFGNYGKYRIYERGRLYHHLKTVKDGITNLSFREVKDGYKYPAGHFYPRYFSDAFKDRIIFNGNYKTGLKTESLIEDLWNKSGTDNPRNSVAYVDFKLQLPEEFLHVTDRFSMAHSVEARVPFMDHSLVELVFRIPPVIRTGWNEPKSFLKQIIKDLIPKELLTAPKKGFVLPLQSWTRKELRPLIQETLSTAYLKQQGIFSVKLHDEIIKPHLQNKKDYTQQVWTLFMFQLWNKRYKETHILE
jgi:asparagine synthase (glutamine-hydrolysing)